MTTKEILAIEKDNQTNINLIKEGIFWRAYNLSAYLVTLYIRSFKINKRYIKKVEQEIVFIGFPNTILKTIVENSSASFTVQKESPKLIVLKLNASNKKVDIGIYSEWFSSISSSPILKKEDFYKEILKQIRTFPLLERTPIESQVFLSHLQQKINGII